MPCVYVTRRGRPGGSFGCLGSIMMAFGYLLMFGLVIALVAIGLAVVAGALAVALVLIAADRLLLATSARYRSRRAVQGPFKPASAVIDTTAHTIESVSKSKHRH